MDIDSEEKESEPETDEVAEATIIPEDNSEQDASSVPEGDLEAEAHSQEGGGEAQKDDSASKVSRLPGLSAVGNCFSKYRGTVCGAFVGILLLFVVGGLKYFVFNQNSEPQSIPIQVFIASAKTELTDVVNFDKFLILLVNDYNKAYLSLTMSIKPSNSQVYKELNEKRTFFRGVIYKVLEERVKGKKKLMTRKEKLKQDILNALNAAIAGGTVYEVVFCEVLEV
ncbi:MAG: hypothetical protein JRD47_02235 [Deltaproteobacteria bacterium]|nr:hypothetical protein [Deltaproteobacteria bacterium]MBW2266058.1 hypothetical protein [Deltaproteobacteria bacterium]MBW2317515.1 hypothetical protein [Deltaproteobacteria bacterium]MBW2600739.1 hypothetical protein [Deltaproteobacteria bacterium]